MTATARPVAARFTVDRMTSANDVLAFAQFDPQLDGTHPYVRIVQISSPCAAADLLPKEATIERCVTTDSSATVFARLDDATIHIGATPRSA